MAANYKNMLSDTLLTLNQTKSLKKISITDIQRYSGISRQTFYNYFIDIYDLIQFTYKKNIVVHWDPLDKQLDFLDHIIEDFSKTIQYQKFLKDAFEMQSPNNLKDYMIDYCIKFEQNWMQTFYGDEPMPSELLNTVMFAAGGAMHMKVQWIRNDIDRPILDIIKDIIDNENRCLTPLFFKNSEESPFQIAAHKIRTIQ